MPGKHSLTWGRHMIICDQLTSLVCEAVGVRGLETGLMWCTDICFQSINRLYVRETTSSPDRQAVPQTNGISANVPDHVKLTFCLPISLLHEMTIALIRQ